jgi:hypothetical protein
MTLKERSARPSRRRPRGARPGTAGLVQETVKESGSGGRTRTYDTRIMIPLL